MMRKVSIVTAIALLGAAGGALAVSLASAQDAPESLLPPGFDDPSPTPTPQAQPDSLPAAPPAPAAPIAPTTAPVPEVPAPPVPEEFFGPVPQLSEEELAELPTLEELEELSTDQLDDLLGLKPQFDIPPAARRALSQVGLLAPNEGGLPTVGLANQPAGLVRAILTGTKGPLVSRWGHILMRRALASRMRAPSGMDPVEFAGLRAGVLNSLGEYSIARALVQDVDTGNWDTALTSQALTAYVANSDIVGACPAVRLQGPVRENPEWRLLQAICNAYAGEGALAGSQLNAAQNEEIMPEIDLLLAQRYAGAAGRGRSGTTVSWDGVDALTPWRFSLANAVGEQIPQNLIDGALDGRGARYYRLAGATAPMIPLDQRVDFAQAAASEGVLSSKAMIELYAQIYSQQTIGGEAAQRAANLREAYLATEPENRIAAMRALWESSDTVFAGQIATAFAAARIPASAAQADASGELITSMLTAGLDRDAAAWRGVVEPGSLGWALIAVSEPQGSRADGEALDSFFSGDSSEDARKSAFLVAGLAGLERLPGDSIASYGSELGVDFARQTHWTRMIDRAADVNNPAMVALLVGLGMQGEGWDQMTPLHLYHITSALRRVGLEAEARMIAAEAVARG